MRQRQRVLVGIFVDPLVVVLFAESVRTIAETNGSQQAELLDWRAIEPPRREQSCSGEPSRP